MLAHTQKSHVSYPSIIVLKDPHVMRWVTVQGWINIAYDTLSKCPRLYPDMLLQKSINTFFVATGVKLLYLDPTTHAHPLTSIPHSPLLYKLGNINIT